MAYCRHSSEPQPLGVRAGSASVGVEIAHEEALELARGEPPELIIADLVMPGMNGYDFTRALRADELIRETPVVFCTATFDERHVRPLAEACGVSHILADR